VVLIDKVIVSWIFLYLHHNTSHQFVMIQHLLRWKISGQKMGLLGYIVQCDINSENHFLFPTTYNNDYINQKSLHIYKENRPGKRGSPLLCSMQPGEIRWSTEYDCKVTDSFTVNLKHCRYKMANEASILLFYFCF